MALGPDGGATERRGGFTVAGVAERGTDVDTDRVWAALTNYESALERAAVSEDRYGVLYDREHKTEAFTYLAGRRVEPIDDLDPELTVVEVPEAVYTVFAPTAGSVNDVVTAIESAEFDTERRTNEPMFERYDPDEDPTDPTVALELYVPVET